MHYTSWGSSHVLGHALPWKETARGEISDNATSGRIKTFPRRSHPVYGRRDDKQKLLHLIQEETSHSSSEVNYSV